MMQISATRIRPRAVWTQGCRVPMARPMPPPPRIARTETKMAKAQNRTMTTIITL